MSDSFRMISPRTVIEAGLASFAGTPFMRHAFARIRSPISPSPRVMASTSLPFS